MKTRILLLCWISFLSVLLIPRPAVANSAISKRLDRLSRKLIKDYKSARSGEETISLAVFKFDTNKKLARERVGFAVSELLMQRFVKDPSFNVMEREKLARIMSEQRLQYTGAIDAETAVKLGKLIGVKMLLLGSVQKLGHNYQATARLVSVESGEIVAMALEELEAGMFEREARPYLAQIPDRQKLGFYFLYNFRHNSNDVGTQQASNITNILAPTYDRTISPKSFDLHLLGGGLRYYPIERWLVDVSIAIQTNRAVAAAADTPLGTAPNIVEVRGVQIIRANINWTTFQKRDFKGIVGAGISSFRFKQVGGAEFESTVVPMLRLGLEYQAQRRVAFGMFLNYEFINSTGKVSDPAIGDLPNNGSIVKFNKLSFEPTLAFYF